MNIFHAVILGIVEGLTEFLPISSTGHMILTAKVLGLADSNFLKTFEIFIQLGAILSVVFLYFKRIITSFDTMKKIALAFIPTAVIGLILHDFVKTYLLTSYLVVSISLIIGGFIIIWFEKRVKGADGAYDDVDGVYVIDGNVKANVNGQIKSEVEINNRQAFFVGIFQSIAMIPGVSRSAATIIGGQLQGVSRMAIVEFSFLLAIPTMLAASVLDLYKGIGSINYNEMVLLAIGFVTAFIIAILATKKFLNFIQTKDFIGFGVYRIIVGAIFLILYFFGF